MNPGLRSPNAHASITARAYPVAVAVASKGDAKPVSGMVARVADVVDRAAQDLAARPQIGDADAVVTSNLRAMKLECLDVLEMDEPKRGIGRFAAATEGNPFDEKRTQRACEQDGPSVSRTQHGLAALADKAGSLRKMERIDGEINRRPGRRRRRSSQHPRTPCQIANRSRRDGICVRESLHTEKFDRRERKAADQKTATRHFVFFTACLTQNGRSPTLKTGAYQKRGAVPAASATRAMAGVGSASAAHIFKLRFVHDRQAHTRPTLSAARDVDQARKVNGPGRHHEIIIREGTPPASAE